MLTRARRSLITLKALGYVGQNDKRFHLRPKIMTLGSAFYYSTRIDEVLQPFLRDLVAKKRGSVLLVSSNSAPMVPEDDEYVQACLAGDEDGACANIETRDGHTAYAGSKRAITMWMQMKRWSLWIKL